MTFLLDMFIYLSNKSLNERAASKPQILCLHSCKLGLYTVDLDHQ